MVSKASLETLARTMSIGVLALAVITVGKAQMYATQSAQAAAPQVVAKAEVKESKREGKKVSRNRPASQRTAPQNLEKRGIWLKELLYEAGFRGQALRTAWAVAMKESTGRPNALNDNSATGDESYGLFQINMIGTLADERKEKFGLKRKSDLFDPLTNAEAAFYMSNGGEDWSSWDIDENGYNGGVSESRYREWLAQYPKG